jgi:type II secretory pathway component PulF
MTDHHQIALFHRTLAELCRSGIPLGRAFRLLASDLRRGPMRGAAEAMAAEVERGTTLAQAYANHADAFPPIYGALVEAGIASGDLPGTLEEVARIAALRAEAASRLRRATIYPLVVAVFVAAIGGFLFTWVVPRFADILMTVSYPGEQGQWAYLNTPAPDRAMDRLPGLTRFLLNPFALLGTTAVAAAAVLLVLAFLRSPLEGSWMSMGLPARFPVLGPLRLQASLATFAATVAMLVRRGLPLHRALDLAGAAADSGAVRRGAEAMARSARGGAGLADAARDAGIFPPSMVWLLASGEARGDPAAALDDLATLFRDRLQRGVETLAAVAGPLAEAVLGGYVFVVILAVVLPILRLQASLY